MIDADGLLLTPGFIDLQFNGGFGHDFTADPTRHLAGGRAVAAVRRHRLPADHHHSAAGEECCRPARRDRRTASRLPRRDAAGLHIEGPFLNPAKKGAHNPDYLRLPDWTQCGIGRPDSGVRLVTLAPELPGALEVIEALSGRGVLVSAGHSMATYDEAMAGFDAGIRYGTHLFNAMPSLLHRDPGLPGALLTDERPTVGLIADGIHTHPAIVKLVWQALGRGGSTW